MRSFFALFKKELKTYFSTPLYYVVGAVYLALSGLFFVGIVNEVVLRQGDPQMVIDFMFSNMSVILLFITPIFTMRLIAEERKTGTDELLFTSPIHPYQIVLAKFLACLVFYLFLFTITVEYLLILGLFKNAPSTGVSLSGYIGIILIATAYVAIGLFSSSLTRSQMTSGMLGFGLLLLLWIIDFLGGRAGEPWGDIFKTLSVFNHVQPFQRGLLDLAHIFYFFAFTAAFLMFTNYVLKARR